MINWPVRFRSKAFWLALIPALLVLIQVVAALFGFTLNLDLIQAQILDVVNAVFVLMTILGITVDVTTPGWSDSELTMDKTEPSSFTKEEAAQYFIDNK